VHGGLGRGSHRNISKGQCSHISEGEVMKVNKSGGDMYEGTCTTNPMGGKCPHECSYCYVPSVTKINRQLAEKYSGPPKLYENILTGSTGKGKRIFVCSMTDLFAEDTVGDHLEDIRRILEACREHQQNTYIFQTKSPYRMWISSDHFAFPRRTHFGTTIETNRLELIEEHSKAPPPMHRASIMPSIKKYVYGCGDQKDTRVYPIKTFVTIEPIMAFDLDDLVNMIEEAEPD